MRTCPRCKTIKPLSEFYNRRNKVGNSVYCKPCTTDQTLERMYKFKQQCIDYKGGKCSKCQYNKCLGALEFHHLDPSEKDFNICTKKCQAFSLAIKKELDKCICVCSNCHKEIHYKEKKSSPARIPTEITPLEGASPMH